DEPKFHDQAGSVVGGAVQLGEWLIRVFAMDDIGQSEGQIKSHQTVDLPSIVNHRICQLVRALRNAQR
ncbi:TPA: hypothetical protein ACNRUW_006494, partial [Pseudomonas aeruginosa]